jgi:ketosteroid isomerase-like protein
MSDELRAELEGELKAWGKAIVANDAEAIGGFATEDWVLVTPEGGPIDSSMFLGAVRSGALTHDTFEVEVQRALDYGEVAVAIAHVTNSGSYQGAPFTADEWTTDVFVRRDGRWTCALTALTPRTEVS